MPELASPTATESKPAVPLPIAEHNAWRLVNHGLAWSKLGVMILALAGLCALLGEALEIIASSTNSSSAGMRSSGGKNFLGIKVLYIVSSVGGLLGLIALTTGLALSGALSPVRTARWLAFATLGASYAAVYSIASTIFWYLAKDSSSRGTPESGVYAAHSIILAVLSFLMMLLLGQAFLASLAHAWDEQKMIARIKWYLKCQFALPALLLAVGFSCGLLLAPNVAIILIVVAALATYVYLAFLLLKNIYLLHRSILWQLEPELMKVAPPPPPKPVIDPLAD